MNAKEITERTMKKKIPWILAAIILSVAIFSWRFGSILEGISATGAIILSVLVLRKIVSKSDE